MEWIAAGLGAIAFLSTAALWKLWKAYKQGLDARKDGD